MLLQRNLRAAARPNKGGARPQRCKLNVRASANPAGTEKFDYIVVGGGTAGCVLANRLTTDGTKRVLVLEAGGPGGWQALESRVPAGLARLFRHPKLDWNLFSTAQRALAGSKEVYLARGKLMGGSSATNATLYLRGTPADYDDWGLEGWSASDVLPWFIDAEDNTMGASRYHGKGGCMHVESPRYQNPLHEEFFRAAEASGIQSNPDFNDWSRTQEGYGEFQVSQKRGIRADAFTQYMQPIMGRPNLKVVTGARTTRVAIDSATSGARAVGVEFSTQGKGGPRFTAELAPGGEVLCCAGTVATPQLLMLSGLGPSTALSEAGLPVVADLPGVGSNLQDHPATLYTAQTIPELQSTCLTSQIYDSKNQIRLDAVAQLLLFGNGPLATTGCDHGAFISTRGEKGRPDLQIRFVPAFALDPDAIQSYVRFGVLKEQGKQWPGGITMQLLAVRPRSRGSVSLRSTDPFDLPKVDLGYFTDQGGEDLATLVSGLKLARVIASQPQLKRVWGEEVWPPPAAYESDGTLEDYVRSSACSGNALVGTCRMGASPTDGSVVSSNDLSVWGVQGLRVVDASVMPAIPAGQTGAPTVMIAERLAARMEGSGPGQQAARNSTSVPA